MRRLVAAVCVVAGSVMVPMASVAAGGGGCHNIEVTEGSGETVELKANCFTPTVLRVAPGTSVTFVNTDPVLHALSGINLGAYEEISAGDSTEIRFDGAGTYPYMCHLHPTMTGAVIVGDGRGTAVASPVAEPVLAGTARPAPASDGGGGVHPAGVGAVAAALGLGAGVALQRKRGVART